MGEITAILAELRRLNPEDPAATLAIYADALMDYRAAQANISEHGAVVFHPRTGAPIDNPYTRIRAAAAKIILATPLEAGPLWPAVPQ
jgi:phage terminase small subunit